MRLVNCPICGARCSEETEKCPECGFEIRDYFKGNIPSDNNNRCPIVSVVLSILTITIVVLLCFVLSTKRPSPQQTSSVESVDEYTSIQEPTQEVSSKPPGSKYENNVSGVYSGDDHEILVLNSDGLAYYYCSEIAFTELECPWYIENNSVSIEFSRLHCTVTAKVDEKELLFKSDSANWNTELFTRLDVEPSQYLTKILSTHDSSATLNIDGTLTYCLDETTYTLPKSFIDYPDESDYNPDWSIFIDEDAQSNYVSSLLFYKSRESPATEDSIFGMASGFVSRFLDSVTINNCMPISIAGYSGYICETAGYYNQGFGELEGYASSGYLALFHNENTHNNNYIMMIQNSGRNTDNTAVFDNILKTAN